MLHGGRPPLSNGSTVAAGGRRPEATGIWDPAADLRARPPILMHPEVRTTNPHQGRTPPSTRLYPAATTDYLPSSAAGFPEPLARRTVWEETEPSPLHAH